MANHCHLETTVLVTHTWICWQRNRLWLTMRCWLLPSRLNWMLPIAESLHLVEGLLYYFQISWCLYFETFYHSANAVFGKVGRFTLEEVILQLINTKCIHSLLCGLEACPLVKSELFSLDLLSTSFLWTGFERATRMLWDSVKFTLILNCQVYVVV